MEEEARFEQIYNDQWKLLADASAYNLSFENEEGTQLFYKVVPGKYGNPMIIAEPDLAFEVPNNVDYVDMNGRKEVPLEKIAGIVCRDNNRAVHRFSLSNPNKPETLVKDGGAVLEIEDQTWYLHTLYSKDKNRIVNYDAYYSLYKPEVVQVTELADLDFGISDKVKEVVDGAKARFGSLFRKKDPNSKGIIKKIKDRIVNFFTTIEEV